MTDLSMPEETRVCNKCAIDQDIGQFRRRSAPKQHLRYLTFISCELEANRVYHKSGKRDKNKAHLKNRRLQLAKNFGLTVEAFNNMLEAQNYVCAICGNEETELNRTLCVDHDHETGEVRALLCGRCNRGLGLFGDDPMLLKLAADYLRIHKDGE